MALAQANRFIAERRQALTESNAKSTVLEKSLAKEVEEKRQKKSALEQVRNAAPEFFELARTLAEKAQYDDALRKLESAVAIDPNDAEFQLLQRHLFEATEELDRAAEIYRNVLKLRADTSTHASARLNLEICEALRRELGAEEALDLNARGKLYQALLKEWRVVHTVVIERKMAKPQNAASQAIQTRLSALIRFSNFGQWSSRLRFDAGGFSLDLSNLALTEVPDLSDLPITSSILDGTNVQRLDPLRSSRLESLSANRTAVADLAPLSGLPLKNLSLRATSVTNLAPLAGLKLRRLVLSITRRGPDSAKQAPDRGVDHRIHRLPGYFDRPFATA